MKKFTGAFIAVCLLMTGSAFANDIHVCFTPNQSCLKQVVNVINHADKTLKLQVYDMTSPEIVSALSHAKKRGVNVQVLLDQSNAFSSDSVLPALKTAAIPHLIDTKSEVVLSNILIADNQEIVTGMGAFMNPAKVRMSDDIVFIRDEPDVINQYLNNFLQHQRSAQSVEVFCKHSAQCKFSQAAGSAKKAAVDAWSGTKNFWKKHVSGEGKN